MKLRKEKTQVLLYLFIYLYHIIFITIIWQNLGWAVLHQVLPVAGKAEPMPPRVEVSLRGPPRVAVSLEVTLH